MHHDGSFGARQDGGRLVSLHLAMELSIDDEPTPVANPLRPLTIRPPTHAVRADGGMARAIVFGRRGPDQRAPLGGSTSTSISRGATKALDFTHFGPGPCCWRCFRERGVSTVGARRMVPSVVRRRVVGTFRVDQRSHRVHGVHQAENWCIVQGATPCAVEQNGSTHFTTQNISRTTHTPALALYLEMAWLLLLLLVLSTVGLVPTMAIFQPEVITVESHPSRQVFGSLSMPEGSPWCDGMPTYWLVR
jgi:hypothetical protein